MWRFTHHVNVRPVLPGPESFMRFVIAVTVMPGRVPTMVANTVPKMEIAEMQETRLFSRGSMQAKATDLSERLK